MLQEKVAYIHISISDSDFMASRVLLTLRLDVVFKKFMSVELFSVGRTVRRRCSFFFFCSM